MSTNFSTGLPESPALILQCCEQCGHVNYPSRELCGNCLADALALRAVDANGVVQASVELHYSLEQEYASHLPWPVGSIRLDCGPVVLAHLQPGVDTGSPVKITVIQDITGNRMLAATGKDGTSQTTLTSWLAKIQFKEVCA